MSDMVTIREDDLIESVAAVSADNPQTITDRDLKPMLVGGAPASASPNLGDSFSMEQMERLTIQQALRVSAGRVVLIAGHGAPRFVVVGTPIGQGL